VYLVLGWVNWRVAFGLFGLLGVAWAAAFARWFRDNPREHPAVNAAEAALLPPPAAPRAGFAVPWRRLLGARAVWLLAKVHLLAGLADRSLHYADACLAQCVEHGLVDFDLAYAHEARGRALIALGRRDEGLAAWATAKAVPVADAEDRAIVEADFADAPEG
jgi:hypothetical protein